MLAHSLINSHHQSNYDHKVSSRTHTQTPKHTHTHNNTNYYIRFSISDSSDDINIAYPCDLVIVNSCYVGGVANFSLGGDFGMLLFNSYIFTLFGTFLEAGDPCPGNCRFTVHQLIQDTHIVYEIKEN